jgi:undecaprenyl-diphosphatase
VFLKYIILGIIQGLTEFLPVSSSGHLVIAQHWLNIADQGLILDIFLHAGTLLAVIIFFRREIIELIKTPPLWKYVIITTVLTAIIAVLGKNFFEGLFSSTRVAGLGLFITAAILFSTGRSLKGERLISDLNIKDALLVGLFQALAIVPGISRSGSTISSQLWRGVEKETAFRYSFLVSIPAILGALLMEGAELKHIPGVNSPGPWLGFLSAVIIGLVSLKILRLVIQKAKFSLFGYYCLLVGLLVLILG